MHDRPIPFGYAPPPAPGAIWGHPGAPPLPPPFAVGELLDIPVYGAALPHLCAKCGGTHELRGRMELLSFTPSAAYLGLLLGALPGLVLIAVLTKKTTTIIPLCVACDQRWTSARRWWGLSVFLPLPLLIASWWLSVDYGAGPLLAFLPFLVSAVAGPTLVKYLLLRRRTLWLTRVYDQRALLAGAGPAMLSAVPRVG